MKGARDGGGMEERGRGGGGGGKGCARGLGGGRGGEGGIVGCHKAPLRHKQAGCESEPETPHNILCSAMRKSGPTAFLGLDCVAEI